MPLAADGTLPFARYVVRERGKVEVGNVACSMCHTRVMPGGATILGAQGNCPFDAVFGETVPSIPPQVVPGLLSALVGAPWDRAGTARLEAMTPVEVQRALMAIPAGVLMRQGTSLLVPAEGFRPPADHDTRYDILDARVDTDPALTMTTRRGTGYYKIRRERRVVSRAVRAQRIGGDAGGLV